MFTGRMHRLLLGALLTGALLPLHAAAQQCSADPQIGLSVSPAIVSFSTPTFVDFDNGFIMYQTTVTLNVTSNQPANKKWRLCVAAQQPDLGTSNGVTKPLSDLQFQYAGGGWIPLSLAPQIVTEDRGSTSVQLQFRMLLSWTADPVGTFGTTLEFMVR